MDKVDQYRQLKEYFHSKPEGLRDILISVETLLTYYKDSMEALEARASEKFKAQDILANYETFMQTIFDRHEL